MAQKSFKFGWTKRYSVPAQTFGEWLYALPNRSAEGVVTAAEDPKCIAHRLFEWNDGAAARRYRLQQAQEAIACLTVEVVTPHRKPAIVRAFITSSDSNRYVIFSEATADELDKAEQRCVNEMTRMRAKWQGIQLARGVVREIDAVRQRVSRAGKRR